MSLCSSKQREYSRECEGKNKKYSNADGIGFSGAYLSHQMVEKINRYNE
jgi:hypothetical protein